MDRVDAMRLFLRVAEAGSFSHIAKEMNVARSVVTRAVSSLESHLGTKLLARSTRRMTLTSSGAIYLEKCREIVDLIDAAETDIAEERGTPRGPIKVNLPLSYGMKHLVPLMLSFAQEYPEVQLNMDFSDIRVNLVEGGIDLAVRVTRRLDPNDVARKIGACELWAVASPDYLQKVGVPQHPDDLVNHQCLGYSLGGTSLGWTFEIDGHPKSFYMPMVLNSNNGEVLGEAVLKGMGVAIQPDFIARPYIEEGTFVRVLDQFGIPDLGIYAILPGNRFIPFRVRSLLEYLTQRLAA